jgi:ribosomal protein S18 acetylase RimI-like enzyme
MVETVSERSDEDRVAAARLLHDFNVETGAPVGVAVVRVQPSLWSPAQEAYLAELYVTPTQRGKGYGRELITEVRRVARARGAAYAFVVTSEDDRSAQRLYEAAGFRRTEGEGGPLMLAYERDL